MMKGFDHWIEEKNNFSWELRQNCSVQNEESKASSRTSVVSQFSSWSDEKLSENGVMINYDEEVDDVEIEGW